MKKFFIFIAVLALVSSCSDDIQGNSPSIQGELNGVFFRAVTSSAVVNDDETVTITGSTGSQEIVFNIADYEVGDYEFGGIDANEAIYTNAQGKVYRTGEMGDGRLTISKIEDRKLYGEFYFDAQNEEEGDSINFNKGAILGVPLSGLPSQMSCSEATSNVNAAKQAYDEVTIGNTEEFTTACAAYKQALTVQKQICGDDDGEIQAKIDELGDCSGIQGNITVTAGTMDITFDELSIVTEDGLLKVSGETSAENDYSIYFEIQENTTGDDVMQNFEINLTSTYYPSELPAPNDFNNSITENADGTLAGTFSGVVQNDDGGQLELTSGEFELNF